MFTYQNVNHLKIKTKHYFTALPFRSDELILMAYQLVMGYFIPRGYGIMFIVCSYLHFLCSCFLRVFGTEFYNIKYSYLTQIICTQLYYFKYSYLILIICT